MAITLSIYDLFYISYLIIEQYMVERTFTSYQPRLSKKQKRRNAYFEMIEQLEIEDCSFEREDILLVPTIDRVVKPEVSKLSDGAINLVNNIKKEFTDTTLEPNSYYLDEDIPLESTVNDSYISDEDCLSIHDIEPNGTNDEVESIQTRYSEYQYTKIRDNVMGYQQWIVTVIGKEGPYLHISDGEKLWVKVSDTEAATISNQSVLLLDINRTEKSIQVDKIETLEIVSEDYEIPEEIELYAKPVMAV